MNTGHQNFRRLFPVALFALCPALAHAHVGPGHTHGLVSGLAHPLVGVDHILAMVAVGLWAAQRGGRALWLAPVTFISIMAIGGVLGVAGFSLPFVAQGILASVLVLGVLIAAAVRLPLTASVLLIGLFALFHGHAHGTEMAPTISGIVYGLGFIVATAALHAAGIGLGLAARQAGSGLAIRYAGGVIAVCGLALSLL